MTKFINKKIKVLILFALLCPVVALSQPSRSIASKKSTQKSNQSFSEFSEVSSAYQQGFVEFGLEYPTNFGIHLKYLTYNNFYGRAGIGLMPSKKILKAFEKVSTWMNGDLTEKQSQFLSSIVGSSLHFDVRLGWSPFLKTSKGGPYFELGLSHIRSGAEIQKDILQSVTSKDLFNDKDINAYHVQANISNVTAHVGYQIPFDKISLNLELGIMKGIYTSVSFDETRKHLKCG